MPSHHQALYVVAVTCRPANLPPYRPTLPTSYLVARYHHYSVQYEHIAPISLSNSHQPSAISDQRPLSASSHLQLLGPFIPRTTMPSLPDSAYEPSTQESQCSILSHFGPTSRTRTCRHCSPPRRPDPSRLDPSVRPGKSDHWTPDFAASFSPL